MSQVVRPSAKQEQELMASIWDPRIKDDPLAFVLLAFPWGKENTPLAKHSGPRAWQRDELSKIAAHIKANKALMAEGKPPQVYNSATTSGRGTGKSSLVAWLNLWMLSTQLGATCIVTANNETQLKTRTWAELGKWHTLAINSHWFDKGAMSLKPHPWYEKLLRDQLKVDTGYYYAQAQLWTEENPDAFAGVHNEAGILVIFDEASGIPKPIWTVSEGFFTEPILHRYHFAFSNPRRNTGEFYECFHKHRNFWNRRHLDSRKVEGTDKALLDRIIAKHGEDSDEARVEVKGEFPRQGDRQFISRETVEQARDRELVKDPHAALVMGVDPARYGDDSTVIRFRQGRDARSIPPVILKGRDNMAVANECARLIEKYNPDAVFIDSGNGTGIIDRLRELGYKIIEVGFGTGADDDQWANKRTELWARMRDWLGGGCIDSAEDLKDDLVGPQYKFQENSDKIRLETKEEMKKRALASPDHGDALAVTFFARVARKDLNASRSSLNRKGRVVKGVNAPVF